MKFFQKPMHKKKFSPQTKNLLATKLRILTLALSLVPSAAFAIDYTVTSNSDLIPVPPATMPTNTLRGVVSIFSAANSDTININVAGANTLTLTDNLRATRNIDYARNSANFLRVALGNFFYRVDDSGLVRGSNTALYVGNAGSQSTGVSNNTVTITGDPSAASNADVTGIGAGIVILGSGSVSGTYQGNALNVNAGTAGAQTDSATGRGAGIYILGSTANNRVSSVSGATIDSNVARINGGGIKTSLMEGAGFYTLNRLGSFTATVTKNSGTATNTANSGSVARGAGAFFENGADSIGGTFTENVLNAIASNGDASTAGGGVYTAKGNVVLNLNQVAFNRLNAQSVSNRALARGAGAYLGGTAGGQTLTIHSGVFDTNSITASSTSNGARAEGGGLYAAATVNYSNQHVSPVTYTNNRVEADTQSGSAVAQGANLFLQGGLNLASNLYMQVSSGVSRAVGQGFSTALSAGGGIYFGADSVGHNNLTGGTSSAQATTINQNTIYAQTVRGNAQAFGGGIYAPQGDQVSNTIFDSNYGTAISSGGNSEARGGGAYYSAGINNLSADFTNNRLLATTTVDGTSTATGAGFHVSSGGLTATLANVSKNILGANTVRGTVIGLGAGGYIGNNAAAQAVTINNGKFHANRVSTNSTAGSSEARGGGLFIDAGLTTLTASFVDNKVETRAGGAGTATATGAGLHLGSGALTANLSDVIGNTITAKAATGNSLGRGAGLYVGSNAAGQAFALNSGSFSNNTITASSTGANESRAEGGGLYAAGSASLDKLVLGQDSLSPSFINNKVSASSAGDTFAQGGGAYFGNGFTLADGNKVEVSHNQASAISSGSGKAYATGGGFSYGGTSANDSYKGLVSNNTIIAQSESGSAEALGGGFYGTQPAQLSDVVFTKNTATASSLSASASAKGGGIYLGAGTSELTGDLTDNTARAAIRDVHIVDNIDLRALGGGAYVDGGHLTLHGNTISGNTVAIRGARYVRASSVGGAGIFMNTANNEAGQIDLFADKADIIIEKNQVIQDGVTTYDGILFGRSSATSDSLQDAVLNIYGSNSGTEKSYLVRIEDGVNADMNAGKSFSINREIRDGEGTNSFYWNGRNQLKTVGAGAKSSVKFTSGNTILGKTFTLGTPSAAQDQTESLSVSFGKDHTVVVITQDRVHDLAFFDLKNAKSSEFTVEKGSRLIAPLGEAQGYGGRYLFVNGVALDSTEADNFTIANNEKYRARLVKMGDQIWLEHIWSPNKPLNFKPNTERAFVSGALTQLLTTNPKILGLDPAARHDLIEDINSLVPEAAISAGLIAEKTHAAAANQAVNQHRLALTKNAESSSSFASPRELAFTQRMQSQKRAMAPLATNYAFANKKENRSGGARFMQALSLNLDSAGHKLTAPKSLYQSFLDASTDTEEVSIWSSYFGNFGDLRSHEGYEGYDVDTNGVLLGANYKVNSNLSLGLYSGYSRSEYNFKQVKAKGDADSIHAGFISHLSYDNLYLTSDFAYSFSQNKLKRDHAVLAQNKAKFDQYVYSFGAELGYDIYYAETGKITPFVGGRQHWLRQESLNETGGAAASHLAKAHRDTFTGDLGIRLDHRFAINDNVVLQPTANVSWQHRFSDNRLSTQSYFSEVAGSVAPFRYTLRSNKMGQDAVKAGLGINTDFALENDRVLSFSLGYDIEAEEQSREHNIYGGIKFNF